MKPLCMLLVVVIAMHTLCIASCYGMHNVSPAATTSTAVPPCHDHPQNDNVPTGDPTSDHDDNACGMGPVTPSKVAITIESFQVALPPEFASSEIGARAAVIAFDFLGSPLAAPFLPALSLKLRI
jgi:hypothetical protein